MKQQSALPIKSDDDFVSECSMSIFDDSTCNDHSGLKLALVFLRGRMKEKEEELTRLREENTRLREEKDAALESKFIMMAENRGLKNKVGTQAKMLVQAQKEKDEAIEEVAKKLSHVFLKGNLQESTEPNQEGSTSLSGENESGFESKASIMAEMESLKTELFEQATMLFRVQEGVAEVTTCKDEITKMIASELEDIVAEIGRLKNKVGEQGKMLDQVQKEKYEALEQVKLCKGEIEEVAQKLCQAQEKEVKIEFARKIKEEVADTRIGELEKAFQNSQSKIAELEEKCMEKNEIFNKKYSRQNMILEELDAKMKEAMEKAETAQMQVQTAKDEVETAARDRKAEVDSQQEIVAEMVKNATRSQEKSDAALNQRIDFVSAKLTANVADLIQKNTEATSKLSRADLSLGEVVKTLSKLETEVEHTKFLVALGSSVWKSSGSKAVRHVDVIWLHDALNCAPLKSGMFEWKIRVHCVNLTYLRFGVIASSLNLPLESSLGVSKKSWGYQNDGYKYHDNKQVGKRSTTFTTGSLVHFVLDLTEEGTLCVSVNESPLFQIFSNMKSFLDKDEGFVPATSLYANTKIELLDFRGR